MSTSGRDYVTEYEGSREPPELQTLHKLPLAEPEKQQEPRRTNAHRTNRRAIRRAPAGATARPRPSSAGTTVTAAAATAPRTCYRTWRRKRAKPGPQHKGKDTTMNITTQAGGGPKVDVTPGSVTPSWVENLGKSLTPDKERELEPGG